MSKKADNKHDELENVQHALTTSEAFIEKYQKQILTAIGIIVLVVLAILAFRSYYLKPREVAAENEMSKAQAFFAADSFKVALDGNKDILGFKEIASDYSLTASGNLALLMPEFAISSLVNTKMQSNICRNMMAMTLTSASH